MTLDLACWYRALEAIDKLRALERASCPACGGGPLDAAVSEARAVVRCAACGGERAVDELPTPPTGVAACPPFTTLFRPVGPAELAKVAASGWRRFPPRLAWQPIFYPVLDQAYAEWIAREWNATDPETGGRGHVLAFDVRTAFLERYPIQVVGRDARELWVPAGDLDALHEHLRPPIRIVASFAAP